MSVTRVANLLAAARLVYGKDARGLDVERTDHQGRPVIEHLVEAYDVLVPADWPPVTDALWPVFAAAQIVVGCFHLGASVETSEVGDRIALRYLIDAVGDYNASDPALSSTSDLPIN